MTRAELADLLARYFAPVAAAELDRLHHAVEAMLADPAARAGLLDLRRDARPLHGLAWWEAHGADGWGDIDFAALLLLSEPRLDPRPRPRLHTPAVYVGRWRDPDGHTWTLADGGELDGPARVGWSWCAHAGLGDELAFGPAGKPARERWRVMRHANELQLEPVTAPAAPRVWHLT